MTTSPALTVAIEAAISGGSLCLLEAGLELDHRIGRSNISRAEDLLPELDEMLSENGRTVKDIVLVAVAAGPGSFTGIRIGIATGLGLSSGLGIEMATASALTAMANDHRGHPNLLVAVPAGRDTVCFQNFDTSAGVFERSAPSTEREISFLSSISGEIGRTYLLHQDLFVRSAGDPHTIDFGRNIALAIGRVCQSEPRPQTAPLFISKDR